MKDALFASAFLFFICRFSKFCANLLCVAKTYVIIYKILFAGARMYSMTGYGKGVASEGGKTITVELKTVNHRYLDWGFKTPKNLIFLENTIKKKVGEAISRGHIDAFVTYEQEVGSADEFVLNKPLAEKYIAAANELGNLIFQSQGTKTSEDIILQAALKQPDIIVRQQAAEDPEEAERQLTAIAELALSGALEKLKQMRLREGETLKADISLKLDNIEASLDRIKGFAPLVVQNYRAAMFARIDEVLEPSKIDAQRLATEVALYADHCCIDEEITRLGSHIAAMRALLEEDGPVGRKMDFLVQEFNREANTIGSKANDLNITTEVLAIKNEIEKLREQAANVE